MTSRVLGNVDGGGGGPSFPIEGLTDRELSVLQMPDERYSVDEIGERLDLARKTIKTDRWRAKEKVGFGSATELLQYAVQWTTAPGEDGKSVDVSEKTSA